MTKTTNIIEINGRKYNALTGTLASIPPKPTKRQSIDGVMASKKQVARASQARVAKKATSAKPVQKTPAPSHPSAHRQSASHVHSHAPQTAKTLMRTAVAKPSLRQAGSLQAKHAAAVATIKHTPYLPAVKAASGAVDTARASRAHQTPKSQQVRRFSSAAAKSGASHHAKPAIQPLVHQHSQPPLPNNSPAEAQPSLDIFDRALAAATAHEQPVHKLKHRASRRKRGLKLVSAALAVVLLGGFIAWQNVANVELHIASSHAGFAAGLPRYRPAGFALGKLSYSAGNVALNFHSNTDDRHYALVEKTSDWDSQTLRDSFVANASSNNYQTVEAAGRTIYLYGNNSATWVNGGVWYQISNSHALNTRQLVSIATSM